MHSPAPSPLNPRPPKARGCLVALSIVGGLAVLGGIAAAIVVYRFATSPDGERMVGTMLEARDVAKEAETVPAAKALHPLGCMQAMVMNPEQIDRIARRSAADAAALPAGTPAQVTAVVCNVAPLAKAAPTCAAVASAYLAAVGGVAPHPFLVSVQTLGASSSCQQFFDPHGTPRRSN